VPVKSAEQQALLTVHRVRGELVSSILSGSSSIGCALDLVRCWRSSSALMVSMATSRNWCARRLVSQCGSAEQSERNARAPRGTGRPAQDAPAKSFPVRGGAEGGRLGGPTGPTLTCSAARREMRHGIVSRVGPHKLFSSCLPGCALVLGEPTVVRWQALVADTSSVTALSMGYGCICREYAGDSIVAEARIRRMAQYRV